MDICIIYDTKYGNGKSCMQYLSSILKKDKLDVEIYSVKELEPKLLPEAELYIFSAPTHLGNASGKMKKFIKKINDQKGKKYSVITTCMVPDKTRAIENMEKELRDKGMENITSGTKIKVEKYKGPLEENAEKQLKDLAKEIKKKLDN